MSLKWPDKDPDEILDYTIDWSRLLAEGESITAYDWFIFDENNVKQNYGNGTTVDGLNKQGQSFSALNDTMTIILAEGTNNKQYKITAQIDTSSANRYERNINIRVREK